MTTSIDLLQEHRFLTQEETRQQRERNRKAQWTALVSLLAFFAVGFYVNSQGGHIALGPINLEESFFWLLSAASLSWFFYVALLDRAYEAAGAKELDRLRPMLENDEVIRDTVKWWLESRPLQVRDAKFLAWLLPQWEQEQKVVDFARSLETYGSSASEQGSK